MVDFPGAEGKMCDWSHVEPVEGAEQVLRSLSACVDIYVATGAADSSEADICAAFKRVNLDRWISGYFCSANLGVGKDSPEFFSTILSRLELIPEQVAMVGDSLDRDALPAMQQGMQSYWLNAEADISCPDGVQQITRLAELDALIRSQSTGSC